ncbi:helix-turn-helix transcriptional regulator [Pseudohalioglobus lutimaris]|uniref:DNA-binding response regulator n=1 Tax=Pseudohalioglobus lutimaris TaxID=1737061 RepID=A0A2N5WY86_9GAMM|nr:response regulator transcription factor [Pseudohalioglobus lutimaris]PLW67203.1 DNA-binding response regulator [Pseudohalioglobus lutimaris]
MKNYLIAAVLGVIMALNALDVMVDITLGVPQWHIIQESMIVVVSGIGCVYLLWEMRRSSLEMRALAHSLSSTDQQLQEITEDMRRARSRFSETIHQQFLDWGLTLSEQQVAMLLLKGLSFREIAVVRDTREKTVRQQASSIYAKSSLDGRHTFAAWFLEDFLSADPAYQASPGNAGTAV